MGSLRILIADDHDLIRRGLTPGKEWLGDLR
jgi:hypothetical protein